MDTKTANPTIIKLPTMALRKPPPSEPGAGVSLVNKLKSKAAKPLEKSTNKIQSKAIKPKDMATMDKVRPIKLVRLRLW